MRFELSKPSHTSDSGVSARLDKLFRHPGPEKQELRRHDHDHLQRAAKDHLWMHFTRHSSYADADVPIIVRGEGAYICGAAGQRYLDGLGRLFVSQLGHGRTELAAAAATRAPVRGPRRRPRAAWPPEVCAVLPLVTTSSLRPAKTWHAQ